MTKQVKSVHPHEWKSERALLWWRGCFLLNPWNESQQLSHAKPGCQLGSFLYFISLLSTSTLDDKRQFIKWGSILVVQCCYNKLLLRSLKWQMYHLIVCEWKVWRASRLAKIQVLSGLCFVQEGTGEDPFLYIFQPLEFSCIPRLTALFYLQKLIILCLFDPSSITPSQEIFSNFEIIVM